MKLRMKYCSKNIVLAKKYFSSFSAIYNVYEVLSQSFLGWRSYEIRMKLQAKRTYMSGVLLVSNQSPWCHEKVQFCEDYYVILFTCKCFKSGKMKLKMLRCPDYLLGCWFFHALIIATNSSKRRCLSPSLSFIKLFFFHAEDQLSSIESQNIFISLSNWDTSIYVLGTWIVDVFNIHDMIAGRMLCLLGQAWSNCSQVIHIPVMHWYVNGLGEVSTEVY